MSHTVHLRNLLVLSVALLSIRDINADASDRRILPTEVVVREGDDVQVRLLEVLGNETTCYVRTPLLVDCNLKLSGSDKGLNCDERVHYWPVNGACGFYITNVQKQDSGTWRLTSQRDDKQVVDVVIITVLDKYDDDLEEAVEITKGMTYSLSFSDVNYCIIQNPHDPSHIITNNECYVEIPTVSAADTGTWNAIIGVKGQVEEITKTINVSVFYEHVQSGYTISTNHEAIHIHCNYVALNNSLTMCRYAKSAVTQKGLRLREGMRKGRYEYYGNGLNLGECGLTIRFPKEEDYGPWYCLLNMPNEAMSIVTIVDVPKPVSSQQTHTKHAVSPTSTSTISSVIVTKGKVLKLGCSSNKPLSYCWFSDPNGEVHQTTDKLSATSQMTFSNLPGTQKDIYWFGNCEITIKKAELKHNGTWICHMGPASPGIELTEKIDVRIAETPLVAIKKFVSSSDVKITFQCKTVPYAMALNYCRFQSPTGFGIHIDERVTESNAIEHDNVRYWFSGKSVAAGDCGLVIEPASSIHNGNWMCAANIELNGENESSDTIHFSYNSWKLGNFNIENGDTASIVSMVFSALGIVLTLGILIVLGITYKKGIRPQNKDNWKK